MRIKIVAGQFLSSLAGVTLRLSANVLFTINKLPFVLHNNAGFEVNFKHTRAQAITTKLPGIFLAIGPREQLILLSMFNASSRMSLPCFSFLHDDDARARGIETWNTQICKFYPNTTYLNLASWHYIILKHFIW